jgi:hypothetical protein
VKNVLYDLALFLLGVILTPVAWAVWFWWRWRDWELAPKVVRYDGGEGQDELLSNSWIDDLEVKLSK